MQQKKLIIILADISGYTQFMLENRIAAVHGQLCINALIESILAQVDIPLTLQEIEGDAVFLYAAEPGNADDWPRVVEEVSHKLDKFFANFIAQMGVGSESTPCQCAICRNAEKLGLKIIVHAGEAMFHDVAGRAQVSGPDVILAHRLLKNSLASHEYLLLTEQAFALMGKYLPGTFEQHREIYEGFGTVAVRVRFLEQDFLRARDEVYQLKEPALQQAVNGYVAGITQGVLGAAIQQFRRPYRPFSWWQRTLMIVAALLGILRFFFIIAELFRSNRWRVVNVASAEYRWPPWPINAERWRALDKQPSRVHRKPSLTGYMTAATRRRAQGNGLPRRRSRANSKRLE